jgi:hypothetical protein
MAHFAQLDDDNVVLQVIVVNNSDCLDENGSESEAVGVAFCQSLFPNTRWKQTSYNGNMRFNYAGIGYQYDPIRNAFIPPKPADRNSWIVDETTGLWKAPVDMPTETAPEGKYYTWDEGSVSWILADAPTLGA